MTWAPQLPQGEAWAFWLLRDGVWDDVGRWSDVDYWKDSPRPTWSAQASLIVDYWNDNLSWDDSGVWNDDLGIWVTAA